MVTVNVARGQSSELSPQFSATRTIDFEPTPLDEGAFGVIYACRSIDGQSPAVPLVVKLLNDDQSGNSRRGLQTIEKLQAKIIAQNHDRERTGLGGIERIPALFALPQFSFDGQIGGRPVVGYIANRLSVDSCRSLEHILQEGPLRARYNRLPLEVKLQHAYDLVEGISVLREMSFIHADINAQNLFVDFASRHVIIIDYDSGAVTVNPKEPPTTWGKANEWIAPEISRQLIQLPSTTQRVRVDLLTDTWSVAVGIHYLIFLRHPLFYLNRLGLREMEEYIQQTKWPNVDRSSLNFNKNAAASYEAVTHIFQHEPRLRDIYNRFAVTINEGYLNPHLRTTYGQWRTTLGAAIAPSSHVARATVPPLTLRPAQLLTPPQAIQPPAKPAAVQAPVPPAPIAQPIRATSAPSVQRNPHGPMQLRWWQLGVGAIALVVVAAVAAQLPIGGPTAPAQAATPGTSQAPANPISAAKSPVSSTQAQSGTPVRPGVTPTPPPAVVPTIPPTPTSVPLGLPTATTDPTSAPARPTPATLETDWASVVSRLDTLWGDWPRTLAVLDDFLSTHGSYQPAVDKKYAAMVNYGKQLISDGKIPDGAAVLTAAVDLQPERQEAKIPLFALTPTATPTPPRVQTGAVPTATRRPASPPVNPPPPIAPIPDATKPPYVPQAAPTKPPYVPVPAPTKPPYRPGAP